MRQSSLFCAVALIATALLAASPALAEITADSFIGDWEGACMYPYDTDYKCLKTSVARTSYMTISENGNKFSTEWTYLEEATTLEDGTKYTTSASTNSADFDLRAVFQTSGKAAVCLSGGEDFGFTWVLTEEEVYDGKTTQILIESATIKDDGSSRCVDYFVPTMTCDPKTYESTYYCVYFKREKPDSKPYYPPPSQPYRRLMSAAPTDNLQKAVSGRTLQQATKPKRSIKL